MQDRIYSLPREKIGDFTFDTQVADVFPDMIARSVPGYASILSMIEQLAARLIQPSSNVYDLGCSLGAATVLMQRQAPADCKLIAVDNSAAMLDKLAEKIGQQCVAPKIDLVQADVRDVELTDASLIVLNLTLQFIPPEQRETLLQRVFDGLRSGGALLLSEKICFDDPAQQALMTELHHDFKRANGYSDLEIAQKRTAIENRLVPETLEAHTTRLHRVGFSNVATWFQCFNFASVLAVKGDCCSSPLDERLDSEIRPTVVFPNE